ncbi:MAG: hypothetical protein IT460_14790 [Planctomycetes bacterium]|nr:hypothetical protein [Planctomycetota bacterium]
MRTLRRLLPISLPALALALASVVLGGKTTPVYAEDEKPDPGMGDPAAPSAPGDDDADDDVPQSLDQKVGAAINKGVAWLKQRQLPDGSWGLVEGNRLYGGGEKTGNEYKHPAGATALALYTLLKCKVPVDDPYVKKGFAYLRSKYKIPGGAYECSMQLLAVTAVADPFKRVKASDAQSEAGKVKFPAGDWREWAQKLHDALLDKRKKAKTLGWRYMVEGNTGIPPGGNEDLSSTQLAALGLLAAERCGIKTDSKVWNEMITFAMKQQDDDGPEWERAVYDRPPKGSDAGGPSDKDKGRYAPPAGGKAVKDKARGFAYIRSDSLSADEGRPTGGMTACGIGTIMAARYILMKRDDESWKKRDQNAVQQSIYDGCAWLDANWSPFENPQKKSENVYHIYYLYCVERAFDLIGNNLVGKRHWYVEMAQQLVGRQNEKGFWDSNSTHKPGEVLDTCFSLLFLKRSTKGGIPYGSITGGGDEPPADNRGR